MGDLALGAKVASNDAMSSGREHRITMKESSTELRTVSGRCHCGAVQFEVRIPPVIRVSHCNCSICALTGHVHIIVARDDFTLLSGEADLVAYRFNTGIAKHLFCRRCGIKSFYVPRSHPDGYSVNLNCVRLPGDIEVIHTHFDGRNWRRNIAGLIKSHAASDGGNHQA
jgi:hypothetical protein